MPRSRHTGGRRSKYTAQAALSLVTGVRSGLPLHRAAKASGLGRSTAFRWVKLGRAGCPEYASLATALDRARADYRAEVLEARRREFDAFLQLLEGASPRDVWSLLKRL